jgi:NADH dehydrogenase
MPGKRIIIIGGGFGGLTAARALHRHEVVLIDRTNHHLFQPLLYQVATAALSPGDIAWPLRTVFRSQRNVRVIMDEVIAIDRAARSIRLRESSPMSFDVLIVAPGSRHAYFGHDEWEPLAPGLKTLTDAVRMREKMLLAFEEADRRRSAGSQDEQLTFVIVGGGPPKSAERPWDQTSRPYGSKTCAFCSSRAVLVFCLGSVRICRPKPRRRCRGWE